jgi:hypothetical protein
MVSASQRHVRAKKRRKKKPVKSSEKYAQPTEGRR